MLENIKWRTLLIAHSSEIKNFTLKFTNFLLPTLRFELNLGLNIQFSKDLPKILFIILGVKVFNSFENVHIVFDLKILNWKGLFDILSVSDNSVHPLSNFDVF